MQLSTLPKLETIYAAELKAYLYILNSCITSSSNQERNSNLYLTKLCRRHWCRKSNFDLLCCFIPYILSPAHCHGMRKWKRQQHLHHNSSVDDDNIDFREHVYFHKTRSSNTQTDGIGLHGCLDYPSLLFRVNLIKAGSSGGRWSTANVLDVINIASVHSFHCSAETRCNVAVCPHVHWLFLAPNNLCIWNKRITQILVNLMIWLDKVT